jgi:hypothetical protein
MFTSAMVIALAGFLEPSSSSNPTWMTDYVTAKTVARKEGKPLAICVGEGKGGWNKLSQNGQLTEETLKVLASDYTCVFIDTNEAAGKTLAEAFEIPEGLGLVISDRTGDLQAFRHEGNLEDGKLLGYLQQFADPELVIRRTITNPDNEAGTAQPPRQTYYQQPARRFFFGGMRGGGC